MSDITTPTIGKILDDSAERDAIHIALAPVIARERLAPGQPIGLVDGSQDTVGIVKEPIGIVDPFLTAPVFQGERFWMFLYPMTITSLRHQWTHPAFGAETSNATSERWLRDFADRVGLGYEELMGSAEDWLRDGTYLDRGSDLEDVPGEFWPHYERVTGKAVPEKSRLSFFTCSC